MWHEDFEDEALPIEYWDFEDETYEEETYEEETYEDETYEDELAQDIMLERQELEDFEGIDQFADSDISMHDEW